MPAKLNILILEDRQTDVELMLAEMRRSGFDFDWTVVDSREGFNNQLNSDWDIILADYALPQYDALTALHDLQEKGKDIPLIIVTGTVSEEIAVECMKLGAADYLLKDRLARLGGAVTRALEEKDLRLEKKISDFELLQSEDRYRNIFNSAAVAIWEEDFSQLKKKLDEITSDKGLDFRKYLDENPDFIETAAELIQIRDVNRETLRLFGAKNKDEILGSLKKIIVPETQPILKEEILAIAEGKTFFRGETKNITLDGRIIDVIVTVSIPAEKHHFDRVLVSMMDITERKKWEQHSQRLLNQQIAANQLSLALGESHQLNELYQIIYDHVKKLMDVNTFILSFYDQELELIHAGYVIDDDQVVDISNLPPLPLADSGKGIQSQVIRSGETHYTGDYLLSLEKSVNKFVIGKDGLISDASVSVNGGDTRSAVYVPMKDRGKVIGILQVQSDSLDAYDQEDIDLLSALANVAAIAIQNARLLSETRRQIEEMEVVSRVSSALREAERLDEILPIFLDEILAIVGTSSGSVVVYDKYKKEFIYQAYQGWFANLKTILPPVRAGISGHVLETGNIYVTQDFANDPLVDPPASGLVPQNWGGACLPLYVGKEVTGLLYVSVEHPRQLMESEINLLGTLSEIVGVAIHRTRLHEQTQIQLQRLAASRAIDTAINASMDMSIILDVFIEQAREKLSVDIVNLVILDPQMQTLTQVGAAGFRTKKQDKLILRLGESLAGKAALSRHIFEIPDLRESDEEFDQPESIADEDIIAYYAAPLIAKGRVNGVLEVMHRAPLHLDQGWMDFFNTLAGQAALAIDNTSLFHDLESSNNDLRIAYDQTLEGLVRAFEIRNIETEGHIRRVVDLTIKVAREMGFIGEDILHIRRGTLLHDIGKMSIPDSILRNEGPLSEEEWQIVRQHPVQGHEILRSITFLVPALDIPYCHHEKWDGSGYPRQLKGEKIPLAARIFAIVDVWDALLSDRPYRDAWPEDKVLEYLQEQSGKHFDPQVLDVFLRCIKDFQY